MDLLQELVDKLPGHSLAQSAHESIRQEVCNVLTFGLDVFLPSVKQQAEVCPSIFSS